MKAFTLRLYLSVMMLVSIVWNVAIVLAEEGVPTAEEADKLEEASEVRPDEPRLSVAETVFKFGKVNQGTQVHHSFLLSNVGTAPLQIQRILPGCGCTVVNLEKEIIPADESANLAVVFDTTGFQGFKVRTIRVYTNDPKQPSFLLSFEGTVVADVVLDPPRVYFGLVKKGKTESRTVELSFQPGSSSELVEVVSKTDQISVSTEDSASGGNAKSIKVTLNESVPVGIFKTRIAIKTSSKSNPVLNLPVFARVEGDLVLEPPDASFGLLQGPLTEPAQRSLRLVNNGQSSVRVLNIKSSNPQISTELKELEVGKTYEVLVTVAAGMSGPIRAQIELTTDHADPAQQKLTFQVFGIVSKKGP